ncbi:MAG: hypothetical protein EBV58_03400 [Actinobacteria bacterium]|nr:hypothetical protein [Actinomycetota bacterium]
MCRTLCKFLLRNLITPDSVSEAFLVPLKVGDHTTTDAHQFIRCNRKVVVVAEAWYKSADYEPYKNLRINELTDFSSLVFIEGL